MNININIQIFIKIEWRPFGIIIEWKRKGVSKKIIIRWRDLNGWMFKIEKWY